MRGRGVFGDPRHHAPAPAFEQFDVMPRPRCAIRFGFSPVAGDSNYGPVAFLVQDLQRVSLPREELAALTHWRKRDTSSQ